MDGGYAPDGGRIGPNAITRMAEAMRAALGEEATRAIFRAALIERHLDAPPGRMVPERDVTALHRAGRAALGEARLALLARHAGALTARYLLAHRIPRPVQWLLRMLPPGLAARVLLRAIGAHAWIFAGSGSFRVAWGRPLRLEIAGGPIAAAGTAEEPVCDYYASTFETLFATLVSRYARVREVACCATGATACVFEVTW